MIEILHVSDLHIGKSRKQTKQVIGLLDKIDAKYNVSNKTNNSYLLITGDIVDIGTEQNYQLALGILSRFKGKLFIVPGNHDCCEKAPAFTEAFLKILRLLFPVIPGFYYTAESAQRFDSFAEGLGISYKFFSDGLPFFWTLKDGAKAEVELFGINSCVRLKLGSSLGLVGYQQLKYLDEELSNRIEIPKIVFLHHRPEEGGSWLFMTLQDWEDLIKIADKRASIIAFGHEGPMEELKRKQRAKLAMSRGMEVRTSQKEAGSGNALRLLDADRSVPEQACYRIRVDNEDISVTKEDLQKQDSL